ncbi:MAG: hypothetical protein GC138_04085 [Gammaproteobacteria bacterium]|nr:hypothetical protein [Gammaproteobacteria bacterium]
MSGQQPDLDDYLRLFERYGRDLGSIYQLEGDEDPYAFLFEQIILLLIANSPFNMSLPELFRTSAHRYHRGELDTVAHLSDPDNRHFMLCDLHDLVMLKGGLSRRRTRGGSERT